MSGLLVVEARDYLGGALVVTLLAVVALAGLRVVIDRLLDRRSRRGAGPSCAPQARRR